MTEMTREQFEDLVREVVTAAVSDTLAWKGRLAYRDRAKLRLRRGRAAIVAAFDAQAARIAELEHIAELAMEWAKSDRT